MNDLVLIKNIKLDSVEKPIERYRIKSNNRKYNEYLKRYSLACEEADRNSQTLDINSSVYRVLNTPNYILLLYHKKYIAFFDKNFHEFYDMRKYCGMDTQVARVYIADLRVFIESQNALKYWYLVYGGNK